MTMGKNVLQRLSEYLRDPSAQGKAAPPSAGDPGDAGRPRLTAIEGGQGEEGIGTATSRKNLAR